MANEPSEKDSNELRKRRERLEALKSKRSTPAAEPTTGGEDAAGFGAAVRGGGISGVQDGGAAKRGRQRKMLMKVYKLLTQTPQDEHGHVPDTPFTQAGVARLIELLKERTADPSQPGAKVAENVLTFIQPSEGEATTSSGASVAKLQMIARRVEALRGKGGGAGARKASW